ncbi:MAG: alpha-mannosidase [Verrucomicrobia bacterium]|nr:alpha-mannosidase [Verrucomicrobiota bacterium]MCH8526115.1 alpha-mannosidase [Kiritimatiellia bacterium]
MNLPQNPFLQLTPPRVVKALNHLRSLIWEHPEPVNVSFSASRDEDIPFAKAKMLSYTPVTLPFAWGKLFQTGWFHLELPPPASGSPRYLHWRDQGEGTLFFEETPYYGFDVAHRCVRIPDNVTEAWMESLCLQSAIWHPEATGTTPEGSQLTQAEIVHRNDAAWKAFHALDTLLNLAKHEAKPSPEFAGLRTDGVGYRTPPELISVLLRSLLRIMDDAVNALDRDGPEALLSVLEDAKPWLEQSPQPVNAVLTGHAHIDLVWHWPERCGEYKARHTFASMNRLMEDYPEFRFAYSQSASYEAVNKTCPALIDTVRQRIRQGKWEAVGATYVEMDNLMACGEALARAFLVGQEEFRTLFGESSGTLWLPDVFGYAGCLPQIMRQCNVENFFTTKLTWSNINRFPYSSFIWRGTDGSEVLTHVTQELGYNQNATPEEGRTAAKAYLQSDVHDTFLQPTGFGDGGGGVTPEMCERARHLQSLQGVPRTRWGRIDDFFADLNTRREKLPHYQGELYLEYHRGTFTTHGDLKAAFRRLERALLVQEAVHTLHKTGPVEVHPWKRLIFSQFHDYIPGSSVWEVYKEGVPELQSLAETALEAARGQSGTGPCVFNALPLPRPHLVEAGGHLQRVTLPPLAAWDPAALPAETVSPATASQNELKTDRVQARFNDRGDITALSIDNEPVAQNAPLNQLWIYPDHPHKFPAWDIDRQTLTLGSPLDTPAETVPCPCEPGAAGLAFRRSIGENSHVTVYYRLSPAHPVLDIEVNVDWREEHALLKAHFPTLYTGRHARFGSPFNSVLRGQQPGNPREEAMFEACASRWATVMDDSQTQGLNLMTEAKYGMGCLDGNLHLTLLRSPVTNGEDYDCRRMYPENNRQLKSRDKCTDQGVHTIRYALGAHQPRQPRAESPAALAELLYTPLLPAAAPADAGFLGLDGGESLIPCWSKPLPNGAWILRLHETLGRAGTATLRSAKGWNITRTRLAEDQQTPCNGTVPFRPYEIVSLRFSPA